VAATAPSRKLTLGLSRGSVCRADCEPQEILGAVCAAAQLTFGSVCSADQLTRGSVCSADQLILGVGWSAVEAEAEPASAAAATSAAAASAAASVAIEVFRVCSFRLMVEPSPPG
jgi:hypothetical protein